MNCYFLSEIPAHVKVNGEYLGVVNDNLFTAQINLKKPLFEFMPSSNKFSTVYGDKTQKNLKIYNVDGDLLIYPIYPLKQDNPFKIIGQKNLSNYGVTANVTLLCDGGIKFFLEGTINDIKTLPFIPNDFDILVYSNFIILTFSAEKTAIFIYSVESQNLVFSDLVNEYYFSDYLTVKKTYKTVTHTFIEQDWALSQVPSLIATRDVKQKNFFEIHPYLLPLAFFENLILGADVKNIITPSLNDRLLDLKEFLGKVIKVVSSPDGNIWLIKENALTLAVVELQNRLISNVLTEDYV